jgi:hypothetical protein
LEDNETSSRGRWSHRRRGLYLLVVGVTGAFSLGLAAPVGALPPNLDEAWAPIESWQPELAPDPGSWTPSPDQTPPAPDAGNPDVAPSEPASTGQDPAPEQQPTPLEPELEPEPAAVDDGALPSSPPAPPIADEDEQQRQQQERAKQREKEEEELFTQDLTDSLNLAKLALRNGPCNSLISGTNPAGGESAQSVLEKVDRNNGIVHSWRLRKAGPGGQFAAATARSFGSGSAGKIIVWRDFHDGTRMNRIYGEDSANYLASLEPGHDIPDNGAVILLHEVAHLTGAHVHGRFESTPEFHRKIMEICLGKKPKPQPPRRRGPSVDDEDVPLPEETEPLPESDDPVIDFDSDCPVIRDEDGNILEGGDCGDPGESELPELGDCCTEVPSTPGAVDPGSSELPELGDCCTEVPSDPGESELPELGDCCDEVPIDPGESELPELGECCDEVPDDPGGFPDPDPYDPCAPFGCMDPDPGMPIDPGYGGGDYVDPGYDDWGGGGDPWCCSGGGGGSDGGGGGDGYYYDEQAYWIEEEYAA